MFKKYHYSSTTANKIGRAHRIGKQNRQWTGVTNNILNKTIPNSHSHYNSNETIDVASK